MQDFRKLTVWNKSHQLVLLIYAATVNVPERKFPGLTSQIRRAAASIPANIAEGCGHAGSRELSRFLGIALASAFELTYHLQLAVDLGVLSKSDYARLDARTDLVMRMLSSLHSRVRHAADLRGPRAKPSQLTKNLS
ncbi:MAG: four helix bundle protein [Gemmatimonadaceae bacterium]